MAQLSYNFDTIFTYDPVNHVLVPKFNVSINGIYLPKDVPINLSTPTGGVNLFNYVGKSIVGTWNDETNTLYIVGFA
jgi:hypothetical protein